MVTARAETRPLPLILVPQPVIPRKDNSRRNQIRVDAILFGMKPLLAIVYASATHLNRLNSALCMRLPLIQFGTKHSAKGNHHLTRGPRLNACITLEVESWL